MIFRNDEYFFCLPTRYNVHTLRDKNRIVINEVTGKMKKGFT